MNKARGIRARRGVGPGLPHGACLALALGTTSLGWLLAAGCAVAPLALPAVAGAGSLAYSEYRDGEYVLAVDADRGLCELALYQSCEHFSLDVTSWRNGPQCTAATMRNARGDRLKVWLADVGHGRTAVYIRAGLWGDDLCSRQLACDLLENVRSLQAQSHVARRR